MSQFSDWTIWLLGLVIVALFAFFFWHTGKALVETFVAIVRMIQNWPQTRRAMVEAEARSPGGRYPWWYRAIRVVLVIAMVLFAGYFIYRLFQ
jgi:hypothetical protein